MKKKNLSLMMTETIEDIINWITEKIEDEDPGFIYEGHFKIPGAKIKIDLEK